MKIYKFAPYSFSKLSTHKQCNRKFKYQYIDRAPQAYIDRTALFKGSAIHNILENYPKPGTHKMAPQYEHIATKFIESPLGQQYLEVPHTVELKIGLNYNLEPCEYNEKDALFRGFVDHMCVIDDEVYEILEVDDVSEISSDYEIIQILQN